MWVEELKYVQAGGGNSIPVSVVCDIFIENETTGLKICF
jgi:hypothetical protein